MGKVKQIKVKALVSGASVTANGGPALRPVKAKSTTTGRVKKSAKATTGRASGPGAKAANGRPSVRAGAKKTEAERGSRSRVTLRVGEVREMKVRELIPEKVCGPRTRVQQVFRVEERVNGSSQTHLVFNDRHGWYCEHGTDCPAVGEVRKRGKSTAARSSAWTTNGRMRE